MEWLHTCIGTCAISCQRIVARLRVVRVRDALCGQDATPPASGRSQGRLEQLAWRVMCQYWGLASAVTANAWGECRNPRDLAAMLPQLHAWEGHVREWRPGAPWMLDAQAQMYTSNLPALRALDVAWRRRSWSFCHVTHWPRSLTSVSTAGRRFSDEEWSRFADALRTLSLLTHLDVSRMRIRPNYAAMLCAALRHLPRLLSFDVSGCGLGHEGALHVAGALEHLPRLTSLAVDDNRSPDGTPSRMLSALAPHLACVCALTHLSASENGLDCDEAEALARSLVHVPHLSILNLSYNSIAERGITALVDAFPVVPCVRALNLSVNFLSAAVTRVAAGLVHLPQLTSLTLVGVMLTVPSAAALSDGLACTPLVHTVDLTGARFQGISFSLSFAGLGRLRHLATLMLSSVCMTRGCAAALAETLPRWAELATLSVAENKLGPDTVVELATALAHNRKLTSLYMDGNDIGAAGAATIAASMRRWPNLQLLSITQCLLTEASIDALAHGLTRAPRLSTLHVSDHFMGADGMSALMRCTTSMHELRDLSVSADVDDDSLAVLIAGLPLMPQLTRLGLHGLHLVSQPEPGPKSACTCRDRRPSHALAHTHAIALAAAVRRLARLRHVDLRAARLRSVDEWELRHALRGDCELLW